MLKRQELLLVNLLVSECPLTESEVAELSVL